MICYVFSDQASSQAASVSIWSSIESTQVSTNAATGEVVPGITTAWATPMQRVTDNQWWIPVCDQVPNTQNWATDTWDPSWVPQQGES